MADDERVGDRGGRLHRRPPRSPAAGDQGVENIRGVDRVPLGEWHQRFDDVDNRSADLQHLAACRSACDGIDVVYNLAADMGGMGFIENNKALCMLSVLISTHMLEAARDAGVQRFFYSSSACVYKRRGKQESPAVEPLRESDAYPAMPEDGYGWEKLFSERMARHYYEDFGLRDPGWPATTTSTARTGPTTAGREKAPAATSVAKVGDGPCSTDPTRSRSGATGAQTRSFTYIERDCVEGTLRPHGERCAGSRSTSAPSSWSLHDQRGLVEHRRGDRRISLKRNYNLPTAPQGVRGRNRATTRSLMTGWVGRRRSASRMACCRPTGGSSISMSGPRLVRLQKRLQQQDRRHRCPRRRRRRGSSRSSPCLTQIPVGAWLRVRLVLRVCLLRSCPCR